jgi:hypothetical protein
MKQDKQIEDVLAGGGVRAMDDGCCEDDADTETAEEGADVVVTISLHPSRNKCID